MHTPTPSPTTHPGADRIHDREDVEAAELTREEESAFASYRRHISETSYLPATADYLHVR